MARSTLDQVKNGLTLAGANTNVGDFLEYWLVTDKSSVRPKTIEQYTQIVHQHILPTLGKIKLKDLRPDHIQSLYNLKLQGGTSERTVVLIHAVIHRSLNQALKWGLIGRNPAQAVTRPKLRRKEMKVLNDNQVRTLLMFTKDTRYEAMMWVAVTTGLREGEIMGLKWADLDWKAKKLHIQRQVQRLKNQGLVYSEPKSAAGKRVIVLGDKVLKELHKHSDNQQFLRKEQGDRWQENDLIFPSSRGTPMEPSNLLKQFKSLLKKAGLPDIRFHDLRHTAATLMLQQGIHPKVVQERLGHSDISLTLNTYSHVLPAMQEEAAEKLDELLTPIDIGKEINSVKEQENLYNAEK